MTINNRFHSFKKINYCKCCNSHGWDEEEITDHDIQEKITGGSNHSLYCSNNKLCAAAMCECIHTDNLTNLSKLRLWY